MLKKETSTTKLCVDCKHCKKGKYEHVCLLTKSAHTNIVTGVVTTDYVDCKSYRYTTCKVEAKFFEPKQSLLQRIFLKLKL